MFEIQDADSIADAQMSTVARTKLGDNTSCLVRWNEAYWRWLVELSL